MSRIVFLHQNLFGVGGTVSTVYNLAEQLAERHDVTLASVFRRVETPAMPRSPRVRLTSLVDLRPSGADRGDPALNRRSKLVPPAEEYYRQYSELTDIRIKHYLRHVKADILIGTRPSLNLLLARLGRTDYIRIAQEHMSHQAVPPTVRQAMREHYPHHIQAAVTVTKADAQRFLDTTPVPGVRVLSIPNGVPHVLTPTHGPDRNAIIIAGRLSPEKRYDRVLRAFALLSGDFPSWELRVYGDGPLRRDLQGLALELGIENRTLFLGRSANMSTEWQKGSIHVVSSERESFGMTLVEAMRAGVSVLSVNCPDGPGEIITDGRDGLLAQSDGGDLTDKLRLLMASATLRTELAANARVSAQRFDPAVVARAYEGLFADLGASLGRPLFARWRQRARDRFARSTQVGTTSVDLTALSHAELLITTHQHFDNIQVRRRRGSDILELSEPSRRDPQQFSLPLTSLSAGSWNLYGVRRGSSIRLSSARIDTVRLADLPRHPLPRAFVPYSTLDGFAAVRVFGSSGWFEMSHTRVTNGFLELKGQLASDSPGERNRLRLGIWQSGNSQPVTISDEGSQEDDLLTFSLPLAALQRIPLHHGTGAFKLMVLDQDNQHYPVGFFHGDIADRRRTQIFPNIRFEDTVDPNLLREYPSTSICARVVINRDNELDLVFTASTD